jgi:nucleotide-binding universal stress UspA family protein
LHSTYRLRTRFGTVVAPLKLERQKRAVGLQTSAADCAHPNEVWSTVMVSIKRILCPIDFSEFSRHALTRAVAVAKAHNASVTALHVVPIQLPLFVSHLEVREAPPLGLAHGERERLLRELIEFTAPQHSMCVPIDTDIADASSVHGEILTQAERLRADLIVMGTHGRTGFQRLLLGSVTEKILRTAHQPVLTVGAPAGEEDTTSAFKRILCAIDFSECSIAAMGYALSLAEGADAHVTAVNVIEWMPIGYDPLIGPPTDLVGYRMTAEKASRDRLHKVILEFAPKGLDVEEIVSSGKPHHEILRIAAGQRSDLIVLGIHGRNPVDRMLFGSTAEPLVRRATCPVLTVRADVAAARAIA